MIDVREFDYTPTSLIIIIPFSTVKFLSEGWLDWTYFKIQCSDENENIERNDLRVETINDSVCGRLLKFIKQLCEIIFYVAWTAEVGKTLWYVAKGKSKNWEQIMMVMMIVIFTDEKHKISRFTDETCKTSKRLIIDRV